MSRQTERTRDALIHALLSLINEKHYDQITIQEVVDRANVGRSTFYAHFQNKDDLLRSGFAHVLDGVVQHLTLDEALTEGEALTFPTAALFEHAAGHYNLYRALVWGSGREVLTREGHAMLSDKLSARLEELLPGSAAQMVPIPIVAYTTAGALLLLLTWWLEHDMPHPPEAMDAAFQALIMPGLRNVLHP